MTVKDILKQYEANKENRKSDLYELSMSILYNRDDKDFSKVQTGTTYYGKPAQTYPDGSPMTYCNVFVYLLFLRLGNKKIIDLFGKDPRGNPSQYYTPIDLFLKNMIARKDIAREFDRKAACNMASYGVPVICISDKGFGHMSIISPIHEDMHAIGAGSASVFGCKPFDQVFTDNGLKARFFILL